MNKVSLSACVIWVISFVLSFVLKPGSPYIWLPDGLLLAGFLPLLISYRSAWPWFIFGMGNLLIGFVLQTSEFVPDGTLPSAMLPVKEHLRQMHVPIVWILFGIISVIYGIGRLLKKLIHWLINKIKKS